MKIKLKYTVVLIAVIVIGMVYFVSTQRGSGQYDEFAHCLTEKGTVFYGSFQCQHCNTQKQLFGNSIKYVNYIECGPLTGPINKECKEAGINAYPTWVINGNKYVGVQPLSKLRELTNCPL